MALEEFEIYTHTDTEITTIPDLLNGKDSLFSSFKGNENDLLNYDGGTGVDNTSRILEKYNDAQIVEYTSSKVITDINLNTQIIIPKTLLNKELQSIRGIDQFLKQTNFKSFFAKSLIQLLKDPLYVKKDTYKSGGSDVLTTIYPNISVWIYSEALEEIINISAFVISCNISVGAEGGTFSLTLPGIVDLVDKDIYAVGDEFYSSNFISDGTNNNENYFHKYIQENDLVFIKFEQLRIEDENRMTDFRLNKSVLSGQVYDMIGLVNSNSITTNYSGNDINVSISGNDLMKLLIDDGSYFFPLLFVGGSSDTFVNLQQDKKLIKRVWTSGDYNSLFSYSLRSIADTSQFIINQLANLGVIDDDNDLFSSYGNRRTKVYRLDNEKGGLTDELHKGVWQIIKLLVDENIADRRVADSSLSQPDGSLIVQFQKICQFPFVEFFGDTYGDTYNFIVRQPPFTKSQIISFLDSVPNYEITNKTVQKTLDLPQKLLKGLGVNISKEEVDVVLTINPEDILSQELDWESEIYSYFELKANGNFLGNNSDISLAFLPVIYFPEYANKWGCKKMGVISNYISYRAFTGKDTDGSRDLFREALINDYKYLIDSYSYLPFTRKGQITINGDRRIKRGTWIRHGGTGEIYYVNNVANSFNISNNSIDRTTVLEVNRGMVERYVKGYNGLSYFNIIDTGLIRDVLMEKLKANGVSKNKPKVNVKSNFGVNKIQFDFFYRRNQMEGIL